jgi:ribosomal protein L16 Arg81 hydroxylase
MSAPNAKGFGRHHDENNAYIIQIYGLKNWVVWENSSSKDIVLKKNMSFYLPRNTEHEVTSGDSPSLHLTVKLLNHSPFNWENQNLKDTGIRSFGHLDPNSILVEHPQYGILDQTSYSNEHSLNDIRFKTINWKKVDHYLQQGFLIREYKNF